MLKHGLALDSGEFIPAEELNQERPITTTAPHGQVPEALRLADWLQAAVQIFPQRSEDDPGGYASEVDQIMDDAAAELRRQHARIAELEAQLASAGFTAADMATASAQGFRDGVASVAANAGEPVAYLIDWPDEPELGHYFAESPTETGRCRPLYLAAPPTAQAEGWISVKDRLPEKNTEVLICFAELSIPSTGHYTASALDHEGWCYPQENRLWPGEHPDFEDGGSPTVTHWMPLPAAPGPADGESK